MLEQKLKENKAIVVVIGLGYVGLPLAVEKAKVGFTVIGIDTNKKRVDMVNNGENYIPDIPEGVVKELVEDGSLTATVNFTALKSADAVCICVPTPLDENKDPDISYIRATAKEVAKYLHKGQLICLESTTYPGTTEDILLTEFNKTGLKVGEDFFLVFSPERVDPGNTKFNLKNTTKIIGGVTPECSRMAKLLYGSFIDDIMIVSSPRVAEMEKLLENIFRAVNIGLINEMAILCKKMDISIWEVIKAAGTKPYGFMKFSPGPGIGGHCIPLDPIYLSWRAKKYGVSTDFIDIASRVNEGMPSYCVSLITDKLNSVGKSVQGASILVLGMAFKQDINDCRESPSLEIFKLLEDKGADVYYNDDFIPEVCINGKYHKSTNASGLMMESVDCVVIATNHSYYDYNYIVKQSKLVIDTRGSTTELGKFKHVEVL